MRPKLVLAISTLALGTALTAVPALAQDTGSNPNGSQQYKYPIGRAMNDGGFPQEQAQYNGAQREQRTGSAENTEHAQERAAALGSQGPNGPNYAFGGPNPGGPYYNYAGGPGFVMAGPMQADSGAVSACEARFRSYDPNTGTYLGFDGMRHSCP